MFAFGRTIRPPEVPNIPVTHMWDDDPFLQNSSSENADSGSDLEENSEAEIPPPLLQQYEDRTPMFFTFLIFGLTNGLNANTIMVGAYDYNTGNGYIISIPRDTRVAFERNNQKIVAAYNVGRLGGRGHDGGVSRMKMEVQTLVGFRPDFYICIDYDAFIRMVDAIGGVEIYVPFHMRYDDPLDNLHINIPAGMQMLDGHNSLHFARYRRGNFGRNTITDFQRIEHQQQVLNAVMEELLTPASILRLPEFFDIFDTYVDSNLSPGELAWFANQARRVNGESLHQYTLPIARSGGEPYWYEYPSEAEILELVNRTVNPLVRDITSEDLRIIRN
ncbi:MAG: LCP family protein [Defluviitaleaceae bacterium]|nr:LCP family protein [Defluviitaleaceae bacterium]